MRELLFDLVNSGVTCGYSKRQDGNMSLSYGDTASSAANRRSFLSSLGVDHRNLVCANQTHSGNVRLVKEEDKGRGALSVDTSVPNTDAFVTNVRNLALAIFTADCLSLFLYDSATPAIGVAHAGWRSTKEQIAAKTAQMMQKEFGTRPEGLVAAFGPALRSCCYEVGREFEGIFPCGVFKRDNRLYLDLCAVNKKQLLEQGIREENIFDSDICTSCRNAEFFSFRREKDSCGRIMSLIMLKN